VSLGDVTTGRLVGGERLAESASLGVLPNQKDRHYRFGTSELIDILEHAGAELYRQTGTRLWVGHLAKRGGGDLPYSVSHNSGRDADLAFCYRDARGAPVDPDDFIIALGHGHTTKRGIHFDAPRTWLVVKALISYPGAQVQYLFISRSLEGQLLQHAKARGEPKAVRGRAATVLHQPGRGAALHNDHMHLRLYCSEGDVLAGCGNTGRKLYFARQYRLERARFATTLRGYLLHREAELRRRALERIGLLGAELLGLDVAVRLADPAPEVQRAAAVALARFGGDAHLAAAGRWLASLDGRSLLAAAQALATCEQPGAGELLADAIDRATTELPEIMGVAGRSRHLACVPALVDRLAHDDPTIRNGAARALGRLTAHRYVADWGPLAGHGLEVRQRRWRNSWASGRTLTRRGWLMRGFLRAGFEVGRIEPEDAWALVAALAGPEHISANAAEQLQRLFGERGDCEHWKGWLTPRRAAFGLPPPPSALCR
jgi:penicillin-insensitive murein endopeptidase